MCETRWVDDGMMRFLEIYKPIVESLKKLQLFPLKHHQMHLMCIEV